ncbi:MAG: ribonuclease III [Acidobacteriota bacterium]|nr:ribonuclease III [Acidobacteriota bacterium]
MTPVFTTHSHVEADVVRGLLDAHSIPSVITSDISQSVFPLRIAGQWELRVCVDETEAQAARALIESHRDAVGAGAGLLRDTLGPLEGVVGYRFKDVGLLEHALTHRSKAHEDASGGVFDNESMEFLGDAVLGFVIADMLFREFPHHDEGHKSKIKASIVSTTSLARLAGAIDLGRFVLLGRGEEKTGGRRKQALLADCYEALIAAVYLDGGVEAARTFIGRQFGPLIAEARTSGSEAAFTEDWKSALQEVLQSDGRGLPEYLMAGEEGPAHRRVFLVDVRVAGSVVARGEGRSKKAAEQVAAQRALDALRDDTQRNSSDV